MVRKSVEETLNDLLDKEAEELIGTSEYLTIPENKTRSVLKTN